jgi:FkbM family methyltransferase
MKEFKRPKPIFHRDAAIFDQLLIDIFGSTKGHFLGIGANFGCDWSFPLLDKQWTGVYCEPDPQACSALIQNTKKYRDQVSIVNSAVMGSSGLMPFYLSMNSSFLSSMRPDWMQKLLSVEYNKHWDNEPTQVPIVTNAISFQHLINYTGSDFDLIVIDTEGSDSEIATSIDWSQFKKCQAVCLEHEFIRLEPHMDMIKQLYNQGSYVLTDQSHSFALYKKIINV